MSQRAARPFYYRDPIDGWYLPDVRPYDLWRIKRKVCCGNIEGVYSLLYEVHSVYRSETWVDARGRRLDQHARTPDQKIFCVGGWYLARGILVRRTWDEPLELRPNEKVTRLVEVG